MAGELRGYPLKQGPLLTEIGETHPFPTGWAHDPRVDDGHAHDWEVVMLGPPGHWTVEEVVRCATCLCPRCGNVYDENPCMLRRHHQPRWPEHEYANGGREKVGE